MAKWSTGQSRGNLAKVLVVRGLAFWGAHPFGNELEASDFTRIQCDYLTGVSMVQRFKNNGLCFLYHNPFFFLKSRHLKHFIKNI